MKYGAQTDVFRMIPGLHDASFARLGGIHRNTFLNSPRLLDGEMRLRSRPNIRFAGQITGVEGYVGNAATGLLATAVAAPAVAQDSKIVNIPEGEPITLGVYQVLSGPNAVLGQDMVYGIEVAVEDRGGEILGHEIELNIQDELCTVEGGAQAALALANDPTVVGVVGSSCSDATVGGIHASKGASWVPAVVRVVLYLALIGGACWFIWWMFKDFTLF